MKKLILAALLLTGLLTTAQTVKHPGNVQANGLPNGTAIDTLVTQDATTGYMQRTSYTNFFAKLRQDLLDDGFDQTGQGLDLLGSRNYWLKTQQVTDSILMSPTGTGNESVTGIFWLPETDGLDQGIDASISYSENVSYPGLLFRSPSSGFVFENYNDSFLAINTFPNGTMMSVDSSGVSFPELTNYRIQTKGATSAITLGFLQDYLGGDGSNGYVEEAPNDGEQYVRQNEAWASIDVSAGNILNLSIEQIALDPSDSIKVHRSYVQDYIANNNNINGLIRVDEVLDDGYLYTIPTLDRSLKDTEIGYGSLDLQVVDSLASPRWGTAGNNQLTLGYNNRTLAFGTLFMGQYNYQTSVNGENNLTIGYDIRGDGWGSFNIGAYHEAGANYSFTGGTSNDSGDQGLNFVWGAGLDATGFNSSAIFGRVNKLQSDVVGDMIFQIGNGSWILNDDNSVTRNVPSDAFEVFRNGVVRAPTFDLADYTNNRDLVTVEKLQEYMSGGGGGGVVEEAPIDGQEYLRKDAGWVINTDETGAGQIDLTADYPWTGTHTWTNQTHYRAIEDSEWMSWDDENGNQIMRLGWDRSYDGNTNYISFWPTNYDALWSVIGFGNANLTAGQINGVYIDDGADNFSIELGYAAGSYNATASVSIGGYAGQSMDGWQNIAIGSSLNNYVGDWGTGIGGGGKNAIGNYMVGIGWLAGNWLQGIGNTAIGYNSAPDWPSVASPTLTFSDTDVNTTTDWIYVPNHGLGAVGTVVRMLVEHIPDVTGTPFGGLGESPLNFIVRDADHIDPYQANIYGDSNGVETFNLYKAKTLNYTMTFGTNAMPEASGQIMLGGTSNTRLSHGMGPSYSPTFYNDLVDKAYADQLVLGAGGTPDQTISFDSNTNLLTISGSNDTADLSSLAGGGSGATNLTYNSSSNTVQSDTGTDAVITLANGIDDGLMSSSDYTKLQGLATPVLSFDPATDFLTITPGNSIDLSGVQQSLTLTGNNLSLTDWAGNIDLTPYSQTISFDDQTNLMTISGSGDTADLSSLAGGANPTNLSYTPASRLLSSSTGTDVNLPLAGTYDGLMSIADKTKLNALDVLAAPDQTISFNPANGILTISGNNDTADFSGYLGTDLSYNLTSRLLSSSNGSDVYIPTVGSTYAGFMTPGMLNLVFDNKEQLSILGGTPVDLSEYSQTLSIVGDQLTISDGNTVTIPTGGTGENSGDITGVNIQATGGLTGSVVTTSGDHNQAISIATGGVGTNQIANNSIQEIDLEITNTGANGNFLTYNYSTNGFTWLPLVGGNGISVQNGNISLSSLTNNWVASQQYYIEAGAFYEGSLRALKTNIAPFTESALNLINSLEIVSFDKAEVKDKVGIIIDDAPKEFGNEEMTAVDLYKTIFIQAKAIQELSDKVDSLEKRIKTLENEK